MRKFFSLIAASCLRKMIDILGLSGAHYFIRCYVSIHIKKLQYFLTKMQRLTKNLPSTTIAEQSFSIFEFNQHISNLQNTVIKTFCRTLIKILHFSLMQNQTLSSVNEVNICRIWNCLQNIISWRLPVIVNNHLFKEEVQAENI